MLKTMRKNVKSLAPTLWIVIAAFIIAIFAVWGGAGRLGEKAQSETIAFLGKERISAEAYYANLRQRLEAIQREFRELNRSFIQQLNIPQQVLEQMVQQQLLFEKAKELGLQVSDEEVRKKIVTLPAFMRDGKFVGFDEYKRILEWNRISLADFEESLKKEILLDKIVQMITAGIAITPEELWENYRKQNETAKIEYLVLEKNKITLESEPQAGEIQEYFEKNKEKFTIPERREGSYLFFKMEDLKKEVQISDSDIEKYYQDNLEQFKEPERIRVSRIYLPYEETERTLVEGEAQALLERISRGEDFTALARNLSKDEKAKDGGDWGFDEWRSLPSKEREEINNLEQGSVSGVIAGEEGVAILRVTEREPEETQTLEEVKTRVVSILEDQKARDLAGQRVSGLEKRARKEKSLDVAAQKEDLKVKSTGLLEKGETLGGVDPTGSLSQALFDLELNGISSPIYTYDGVGIVELEKIESPRPAALEEVREDVETEFKEAKKTAVALETIQEAREKLQGQTWEQVVEKYSLEHKSVEAHKRDQYLGVIGENQEVDRLAFSLPPNEVSQPIEFEGGYTLLRVLERTEANREEFEKNIEQERENLLESRRSRFLQSYLNQLREEKKVRINYELFMQINSDILSRFEG